MSLLPGREAIQALRAATRSAHDQLDNMLPVARPDASLDDYANHLAVLKDWQVSLAPWLSRSNEPSPGDLALLDQDLADCSSADASGE